VADAVAELVKLVTEQLTVEVDHALLIRHADALESAQSG
jgi:hypothetical protein